jgi:flagellar motility protein MotE (MotC chaperone)
MEVLASILGALVGGLIGASTSAITGAARKSHDNIRVITELTSGVKHIGVELERFREDIKEMLAEQKRYIQDTREEALSSHAQLNIRLTTAEKDIAVIKSTIIKEPYI